MTQKLLVATSNAGKLCEFKNILAGIADVANPAEMGLDIIEIDEGNEYAANARLKAEVYTKHFGGLVCGEDSGLEVDALDGRPGPLSARYGGEATPHYQKCRMILEELKDVALFDRTARFKATIALVDNGKVETFEGVLEGWIGFEYEGTEGFGYDPIFIPQGFSQTNAQLGLTVKNRISHRAKAIRELAQCLRTR